MIVRRSDALRGCFDFGPDEDKARNIMLMDGMFLALNLSAHFDIDRRQGLLLGVSPEAREPAHEPLPV